MDFCLKFNGFFNRSVTEECRHIIDWLEELRGDKREAAAANRMAHSDSRKGMTSIERLLSLREQLKNVCQLGGHGR